MDKFRQTMMTKKLRTLPNKVDENELKEYFHAQKYAMEGIEEVHRIINNPMLDILPSVKAVLNGVIVKVMILSPSVPTKNNTI